MSQIQCAGDCGRTIQQLEEEDIKIIESIVILDKEYGSICQECAHVLNDELGHGDFDAMHPNETVEEFFSHEN